MELVLCVQNPILLCLIAMRLQVPKSPQTPPVKGSMAHQIAHRFTKTFKLSTDCDLCGLKIFGKALKCSECKYSCHRECQEKVPATCGLPAGYLTAFIQNYAGCKGKDFGKFYSILITWWLLIKLDMSSIYLIRML